nr:succinate dehydrogenase subunit 3 [Ipomoea batatas]
MRLLSLSCCLCLHSHTRSDNEVSPLWLEENEFLSKACLWEKVLLSSKELLFSESRIRILLERPSLSELGQRSKAYAVEADIRLLAFYLHLPDRKEFALFGMNSQRLDPRTSLVEWRLFLSKNFSVELKKKSLSSFGLLLAKRGGYPHVSQSDVHFLDPLSTFNYLLSLVWNHHHYTFILGLADGLASLPSRLECSLPAEDRNFRKGSLMLEGASPLSDRSASSRKSKEVITDEPHAGKLARVVLAGLPEGDRSTSFPIALGLCLDLLCAKSKGLVPIEIPLGLIPRLMTKGESAWRKVKIGGSRENSLLGIVYLYQKKEEKLGHVSRERRLLSGQQSSTSSRLLYDGLPCFLGSARSYTLRPSK